MPLISICIQSAPDAPQTLPSWMTSGSLPVILLIIVGFILIGVYINFRLKRIQSNLHELGKSYYGKERVLLDDLQSGRISRRDYRREHERLVRDMRSESRKISDGLPKN